MFETIETTYIVSIVYFFTYKQLKLLDFQKLWLNFLHYILI